MSDIGFSELLLVLTIALIVIGPKRLPEAARFLGYWTGKLQRAIQTARRDMERELGLDDVRREVHNQLRLEELDRERREVEATFQRAQTQPRAAPPPALPPNESDFIDEPPSIDKPPSIDEPPSINKPPTIDEPLTATAADPANLQPTTRP